LTDRVYTVGNRQSYDQGLKEHGRKFTKTGRYPGYPGGFAVNTQRDGKRLIVEQGKTGEWAVYELEASWKEDTVPSKSGWWHALIRDAVILRKV
jgi:hypothetical protein